MSAYIQRLIAWAEPGYRFVAETVAELAILALRALRFALRALLAAALFPPWLVVRGTCRLWRAWKKGRDG